MQGRKMRHERCVQSTPSCCPGTHAGTWLATPGLCLLILYAPCSLHLVQGSRSHIRDQSAPSAASSHQRAGLPVRRRWSAKLAHVCFTGQRLSIDNLPRGASTRCDRTRLRNLRRPRLTAVRAVLAVLHEGAITMVPLYAYPHPWSRRLSRSPKPVGRLSLREVTTEWMRMHWQ